MAVYVLAGKFAGEVKVALSSVSPSQLVIHCVLLRLCIIQQKWSRAREEGWKSDGMASAGRNDAARANDADVPLIDLLTIITILSILTSAFSIWLSQTC